MQIKDNVCYRMKLFATCLLFSTHLLVACAAFDNDYQDHMMNELSSDSLDYYDQSYAESEELPQLNAEFPQVFCNTHDDFDEESQTVVYFTACSYATAENIHAYQLNQFYLPNNERRLRFSYSNIEYITSESMNSDDAIVMAFNSKVTVLDLPDVNLQLIEQNSFQQFVSLVDLNLSRNKLTFIPGGAFNSMHKLVYLDLSQNRLSGYLDWRNLTGLGSSLTNLDLSFNRIKFIRKHAFFNLTGLETLNLNSNRIALLPGSLFQSNAVLNNIYLSNNTITIIGNGTFAYLNKIHDLDLSHNKILRLPHAVFDTANESTETIDYFNVENNYLETVTEAIQDIEIKEIFLYDNYIHNLDGGKFCDKLNVSHVGLKFLSNISMCDSGSAILASHNELQDIPFIHDVRTVSIVELQYNNITDLPAGRFSEFTRLISLRLDKNKMTKIQVGLFTNLDNLKSLNISFNRLENVNQKVFYGLWQLENLYLGGNQLKTLPAVLILQRLRSLRLLGLNHNPWECSELMDILHVLDMNNIQMAHHIKINYHMTNIGGVECQDTYDDHKEDRVAKINVGVSGTTNSMIVIPDVSGKTLHSTSTMVYHQIPDYIPVTELAKIVDEGIIRTTASSTVKNVITKTTEPTKKTTPVATLIFVPKTDQNKTLMSNPTPNFITYTENTMTQETQDNANKTDTETQYSEHYRTMMAKAEPHEIHEEMSSMRSSIYEMKAVLIIGTLLIACLICIKLYNFYRKNMKPHVITSTIHDHNSVQSITTEIEM